MNIKNDEIRFKISIPTEDDFLGRECNNPDCGRYFTVYIDSIQDRMYCPYCSVQFSNEELFTDNQNNYIEEVAIEKAKGILSEEIDKMFKNLARKTSGNKFVKIKYKSKSRNLKPIQPSYVEPKVDSELVCPACEFRFQVFGIFGYCPGCCSENILIYDANLEIIKQEISESNNSTRVLRHAYSDLVSAFESFCKRKSKSITNDSCNFQNLFDSRKFFKKQLGIDVLGCLTKIELLDVRRVFEKRHACEHYNGIIEERYVRKIPEDKDLEGQKAKLTLDEFVSASQSIRKILDVLVRAQENNYI